MTDFEGPKPPEVLLLHPLAAEVFDALRLAFDVPAEFCFALVDVDHMAAGAPDDVEVAAFAMRSLQVVRRYAGSARPVTTDHFVGITTRLCAALDRLAGSAGEESDRRLFRRARDLLHDATWAIVRDTGGPGSGPWTLH